MALRGIRGAITAEENQTEAILKATRQLLESIQEANPGLHPEDISSVIFTVTDDLNAAYPAEAARQLGWSQVPLLCTREIPVPGGLGFCIRVLLHWNTELEQKDVRHVYLGKAAGLRPDLARSD